MKNNYKQDGKHLHKEAEQAIVAWIRAGKPLVAMSAALITVASSAGPIGNVVGRAVGGAVAKEVAGEVAGKAGARVAGRAVAGGMSSALGKAAAKVAAKAVSPKVVAATAVPAAAVIASHELSAGERTKLEAEADAVKMVGEASAANVALHPELTPQVLNRTVDGEKGAFADMKRILSWLVWALGAVAASLLGLFAFGAGKRLWNWARA